jgi:hypothetical protein
MESSGKATENGDDVKSPPIDEKVRVGGKTGSPAEEIGGTEDPRRLKPKALNGEQAAPFTVAYLTA